jgi:hypothetical protein
MITKRGLHVFFVVLSVLSFFTPVTVGGTTQAGAEYFLITGSTITVSTYIPLIFEPIRILISEPNLIADIGLLVGAVLFCGFAFASISHNYAVLLLLGWSLFFIITNSRTGVMVYRIWLLFSFASSILLSLIPLFANGSGLGFWLNPVLLLIAVIGEILVWLRERKLNRT